MLAQVETFSSKCEQLTGSGQIFRPNRKIIQEFWSGPAIALAKARDVEDRDSPGQVHNDQADRPN